MSFLFGRHDHAALRFASALLLATGVACGSAADDASTREPSPPSTGAGGDAAPVSEAPPAPSDDRDEAAAMVAEVISRAGDQLRAACGATFDNCEATAGCDEILACAARSACSGVSCYCADPSCASPGPCRTVIDEAPGARTPDANDPSLGPASDAAAAVGACLQGLAGGVSGPVPSSDAPRPDAADPSSVDAGSGPPDAG